MSKEVKYPKVIASAFIFNDKKELLLIKSQRWSDKYTVVGGKIELNETKEDAVKREALEEVGLNLKNVEFFRVVDGVNINDKYLKNDDQFIFINLIAEAVGDVKDVDKSEISKYEWKTIEEWLTVDKNKFVPSIYEGLEELKKFIENKEEGFEGQYKRALADYQNLLKQSAKDREEFVKYANEQLILEIIPVYNNLKTSLEHVDETVEKNGWLEGIKYVTKQFKDILNNLGVEEIETKGKKFDPNTMEALEGKGKKVKKEVMPGYTLKEKVIMPAKVILE